MENEEGFRSSTSTENEEDLPIPIYDNLESTYDLYSWHDEVFHERRYFDAKKRFIDTYGCVPDLLTRAPGSVNLLGAHIDHQGYPGLSLLILLDTVVLIRKREAGEPEKLIRVINMDEEYAECTYPADPDQEIVSKDHIWGDYFICGYKGFNKFAKSKGLDVGEPVGLDVLVDGRIPIGYGLSSSTALVCASTLAIMAILGMNFPKKEIAQLICECERYIGPQSGGLNQAICLMAKVEYAGLIEFNPIRATAVKLPKEYQYIIAHTLVDSLLSYSCATYYDCRVVECRLAAIVLGIKLGMQPQEAISKVNTLSDVEALCISFASSHDSSDPTLAVMEFLNVEPYTGEDIQRIIEISLPSIFEDSPPLLEALQEAKDFKLFQRALHVYSEAKRVRAGVEILSSSDDSNGVEAYRKLGELMNESHDSCNTLFDCSCPELEELVYLCRDAGAYGVKLAGSGWGGSVVSIETAPFHVFNKARDSFYKRRIDSGDMVLEESRLYLNDYYNTGTCANIFKDLILHCEARDEGDGDDKVDDDDKVEDDGDDKDEDHGDEKVGAS